MEGDEAEEEDEEELTTEDDEGGKYLRVMCVEAFCERGERDCR